MVLSVLSRLYCSYYQGCTLLTGLRSGSVRIIKAVLFLLSRLYVVDRPEVWLCPYYQGCALLTGLMCGSVRIIKAVPC